jgi:hypothetical protein
MCPVTAEYRSCRPFQNIWHTAWFCEGLSVIWSNLRMASSARSRMGDRLTMCTTTFLRFSTVCFTGPVLFDGSLLCWIGSYLIGRTQRVKLENNLSESIQCHSGVPQGSHLGPIFFILNINGAWYLFENGLGYADDLKNFMTIKCIGDCQLFQRDLDRLGDWSRSNKFYINAAKCIGRHWKGSMRSTTLEWLWMEGCRFFPISRQLSPNHRECWVLLSVFQESILIKLCVYTALVRPKLEHAACVWSPYQSVHLSGWSECNTISFVMRYVDWRGECGLCQLMRQDAF